MATQTPPKTMSSRLLTMKFMQRAAATSSTASSPSTSQSEEQSSKRQKVSHSPAPPQSIDSLVDQAAVKKALAEEERKRQEALVRHAAESGDARWVLDTQATKMTTGNGVQRPLNVVQVGFAQIDSSDNADDNIGSQDGSYSPAQNNRGSDSDDSNSDSDSDSGSDDVNGTGRQSYGSQPGTPVNTGRGDEARKILQSKRNAERAKATQLAEQRRKKEVKLNRPRGSSGLASISSGGGNSLHRSPVPITCHRCHKTGHKAINCKNSAK
ncbi:hypothetical protein DL771_006221 [Monosporascus sp. 5C6A]|nr:hypothetical protein DL771_006221 [Monosporascus sp. 5C6A]